MLLNADSIKVLRTSAGLINITCVLWPPAESIATEIVTLRVSTDVMTFNQKLHAMNKNCANIKLRQS